MADYKAIHGKNIQHLASDLDNAEGEGQIWFNTTSSDYKTIVKVAGAWASGGNLNTGRQTLAGTGTQTASVNTHIPITSIQIDSSYAPFHADSILKVWGAN